MKFALKSINDICSEIHKDVHGAICNKSAVKSVMNLMESYKIIWILVKSCWISGNHLKSLDCNRIPLHLVKLGWILVKFRETF